jgi:hypothetical protein
MTTPNPSTNHPDVVLVGAAIDIDLTNGRSGGRELRLPIRVNTAKPGE